MGVYYLIRKTKFVVIIFFSIILIGVNFVSTAFVSIENSSIYKEIEKNHFSYGAYPLGDEVAPSLPPGDTSGTPKHFDWRNVEYNGRSGNWLTPVKNQGYCGSCWAYAAIAAIEAMVKIQRNDPNLDLDLSEQHLVSCITNYCNGCHGGNSYYSWQYLMNNNGAILESCFPYEGVDFNGCDNWENDDCSKDPVTCDMKCEDWDEFTVPIKSIGYYSNTDPSLVQYTIANHGPVVTYMLVYSDFKYYSGGIYKISPNAEVVGGHAVIIVGYDKEEDYLICKNSRGDKWGEDGYFLIPYGECMLGEQIYFVEIDENMLNFPPNACAGGLYSANRNESISFSSQDSTDLDNNIQSYLWDFGDGTTSTDPNPTHMFNQKGIYPVTLTITDSLGKQDIDETAVFVDLWDIDDSWTYKIFLNTIPDALYPPIQLPFDGEITELTLTVMEENNEEYILDVKGFLKGNLSFIFDLQKSIFDFRLWSKIKQGKIDGSVVLDKKGFGLKEYEFKLKGLANTVILPILPIPLLIPLIFDITIKKTFNESITLMSLSPGIGKLLHIPSANSSSETTISLFFGFLSNAFYSTEIIDETRYSCTNFDEIITPAGRFNSYEYKIDSSNSFKEAEFFYSPTINNIVRFSGGDIEIFTYSGELISTNIQ
jgi:PKD repeat protein